MRRGITVAVAVVLSAAAVGLGAGCGASDASVSSTPADATTIANSAAQTDSNGKTVPAPGASSGAASASDAADGEASGAASGGAADSGGAAAGKTVFLASCQGCHPSAGMAAGVGPQLSTTKMDEAQLKTQVEVGSPGMPGGLASGADLDNVVAYVLSIKQ